MSIKRIYVKKNQKNHSLLCRNISDSLGTAILEAAYVFVNGIGVAVKNGVLDLAEDLQIWSSIRVRTTPVWLEVGVVVVEIQDTDDRPSPSSPSGPSLLPSSTLHSYPPAPSHTPTLGLRGFYFNNGTTASKTVQEELKLWAYPMQEVHEGGKNTKGYSASMYVKSMNGCYHRP